MNSTTIGLDIAKYVFQYRGSSSIDELKTWLNASDQSLEAESRKLLVNYIGVEWEAPSEPAS